MDITKCFLEAAASGDAAALAALLADQPDLLGIEGENGAGDALILAASGGRLDVVELLVECANAHSVCLAGERVWQSASPNREAILALLRSAPAITALLKGAGLPYERRDNFTMTELRIDDTRSPAPMTAYAGADEAVSIASVPAVLATLRGRLAQMPSVQVARRSADFASYRLRDATVSSLYESGFVFDMIYGFEVDAKRQKDPSQSGINVAPLWGATYASSHFRGPYSQLGYAHALLREMIARTGLTDVAREIREVFVYREAPESDANIVAVKIAIDV